MKSYSLFGTDCMIDDGDFIVYYVPPYYALFRIHKITGKLEFLWQHNQNDYFRSFIRYNNKYILFSEGADIIGVLNSFDEAATLISLPEGLHFKNENNWSAKYIRYKNSFFFYLQNPVVTRYNPETNEWKVYRDWINNLPEKISPEYWMVSEAFLHNDKLYFPIGESKYILEIDPTNDKTQIHTIKLPKNIEGIKFLRYKNGIIYIICKNINNTISVLFNDSFLSSEFKELAQIKDNFSNNELFIPITVGKQYLWLLPGKFDKSYKIDLSNGQVLLCNDEIPTLSMAEMSQMAEFVFWDDNCYNYICEMKYKNLFWTINIFTGDLVKIDLESDQVSVTKIIFSEEMCDCLIHRKKLIALNYEKNNELIKFIDAVNMIEIINQECPIYKKNEIKKINLKWHKLFK